MVFANGFLLTRANMQLRRCEQNMEVRDEEAVAKTAALLQNAMIVTDFFSCRSDAVPNLTFRMLEETELLRDFFLKRAMENNDLSLEKLRGEVDSVVRVLESIGGHKSVASGEVRQANKFIAELADSVLWELGTAQRPC